MDVARGAGVQIIGFTPQEAARSRRQPAGTVPRAGTGFRSPRVRSACAPGVRSAGSGASLEQAVAPPPVIFRLRRFRPHPEGPTRAPTPLQPRPARPRAAATAACCCRCCSTRCSSRWRCEAASGSGRGRSRRATRRSRRAAAAAVAAVPGWPILPCRRPRSRRRCPGRWRSRRRRPSARRARAGRDRRPHRWPAVPAARACADRHAASARAVRRRLATGPRCRPRGRWRDWRRCGAGNRPGQGPGAGPGRAGVARAGPSGHPSSATSPSRSTRRRRSCAGLRSP